MLAFKEFPCLISSLYGTLNNVNISAVTSAIIHILVVKEIFLYIFNRKLLPLRIKSFLYNKCLPRIVQYIKVILNTDISWIIDLIFVQSIFSGFLLVKAFVLHPLT